MVTTKSQILIWLDRAKKEGATHLMVVCDTYDWDDYPVNVMPGQDVHEAYAKYDNHDMQKVLEIYNLGMDIEKQLSEHRSFNF